MDLSIREQITKLLGRNLFLTQDMRARIEEADEALLETILPTLTKMDEVQTKMIKSAIEKNPNFFGDIKSKVTHEVLAQIMREELSIHREEVKSAEEELSQMLSKV